MGKVIEYPPKISCPACGAPLRPATRQEINSDLCDARYRQIALSAAQGARDWKPPAEFPEYLKDITLPSSWLFRCHPCGHRSLYSIEHSIVRAD